MKTRLTVTGCVALTTLALVSCGPSQQTETIVFKMANVGSTNTWEVPAAAEINIGVPIFINLTNQSVRVTGVYLDVGPSSAFRILSSSAYPADGGILEAAYGDLKSTCQMNPAPVNPIIVKARSYSDSFAMIALRMKRTGVYHFKRAVIRFVINGHQGWQYQNLNLTITVVNPPDPGISSCKK